MVAGTGTTTYAYDSSSRLVSTTDGASATVTYGYNLRDLLTSIGYPGLGTVSRAYDNAGRIDSITDWSSRVFDYTLDPNGNTIGIEFPAGANTDTFSYDHADRMTSSTYEQSTTTLAALDYTRDVGGRLDSVTGTSLPSPATQTYGYTQLDQLCYTAASGTGTCASPPSGASSYSYDTADNLTATPVAATQRFNDANQLCWTRTTASSNTCASPPTGANTYTHDTRGNRTPVFTPNGGTASTYTYDQANRLTTISGAVSSNYAYNGDGLRTSKTAGTASAVTWSHAEGLPLAISDGTNAYVYGPDGLPLEHITISTSTPTYYHHDHLGSTRLLTNSSGATTGTATYHPYGSIAASTGTTSPLGYAGQYTDTETGHQYLRARSYDPTTGTFLTRDPIEALTRAAYGYAGNNPVNMIDPTGLAPWDGVVDVVEDAGGRAVDVTVAVVNAPVTATTAAINSWTGGDCDWEAHLTVVCYGGAISSASDRTFVTGSTINTTQSKVDFAADGGLLRHETWHTRQWAIFGGGPLFPLLYGAETLRTRGDECRNVFEIWAGLEDGGYDECTC